ncbi:MULTISPECIES: competence/damage-inducible protein A [Legionella]|uniref:Competence/damage-inducible protein A n=1 Tax=Legionella septentrionalis TaxID=2498109 RepID=A0A3S0WT79_9GAMM|nr:MULTISPECIES: competence/damage-inducible protein A [Legionella]MCP0913064.1 competence/damage-inducible protein A [Legionella sp. 27cVA30]RUQ91517.1 competence/damage-inducible protein A [Legionella septentrionalis]RUQ98480.1 competence/damage-inducible protein A [Legionella septentrionalis]RUR10864.1 competence/damage-inducible protein A [Legionella septentrionalis]RUR14603.1 competence/damage-inducible protein A [Legionella septentrionalis]
MTIAILATGDELIHGDILNTNTHALAHALCSEGLSLGTHVMCGDREQEILASLQFLGLHHDIIILTGGLGPTSDDRTRYALASYVNSELKEFPEALAHIKTLLKRINLPMNAGHQQQALFPREAVLLANPYGSAMGCYYPQENKMFFLLPGPPRECLPMFHQYVLPVLQTTKHSHKKVLKWRLFGVAEGEIAPILDEALADLACETGYRWEAPYVEFKVRCREEIMAKVKDTIEPLITAHIISPPEFKASELLAEALAALPAPIAIIDEATGGKLQNLIHSPKTYQQVQFHKSKTARLQFHISGLAEYWLQQPGATTELTIKYNTDKEQGSETHKIPYFSPLVLLYAAEWLSFRLLHLINQLHQRLR